LYSVRELFFISSSWFRALPSPGAFRFWHPAIAITGNSRMKYKSLLFIGIKNAS